MKNKNFKICTFTVLLALFLIGALGARNVPFTGLGVNTNRSWRLAEKMTMIDSSGTWVNNELTHNYFNPNNPSLVDSTAYSYYEASSGWVQGWADYFSYNISQEYITEIVSYLVMFSESIPMARGVFEYDQDNRITAAFLQTSGLDLRDWIDIKRAWISYNNGYLDEIIIWDGTEVDFPPMYYKWNFSIDNYGRISQLTEYTCEDSTNWNFGYRTSYQYHANDNTNGLSLVEKISHSFPQYIYYDQPLQIGMITEAIQEMWMFQYWRNDTRDVYTYDNDNRMIFHQNYYNTMIGEWMNDTLVSFTYDDNGNCDTELQQYWNEDPPEWVNDKITYDIWEQPTADQDEVNPTTAKLAVSVYPNPFVSSLNVSVKSRSLLPVRLELYNSKGQRIARESMPAGAKINLDKNGFLKAARASGIYLLKVQQGSNSVTRKLIRLK
jgi:hypothetical protein